MRSMGPGSQMLIESSGALFHSGCQNEGALQSARLCSVEPRRDACVRYGFADEVENVEGTWHDDKLSWDRGVVEAARVFDVFVVEEIE